MAGVATNDGVYRLVNGLRWFYRTMGEGQPVILLHGIPTSSFLWRKVLPNLGEEYWVVAPDLLGFGRSDKPATRIQHIHNLAIELHHFLERLGITQCALVGHDLGALVALSLFENWPEGVTHLILTNTSLRLDRWRGDWWSPLQALRLPIVGELALALARPWMLKLAMRPYLFPTHQCSSEIDGARLDDTTLRGYWEPFELNYRRSLLRQLRQRLFTAADLDRWRALLLTRCGERGTPLLLAWGEHDPQFRVDEAFELTRQVTGARLVCFAHASHFLPEERPRALSRVIHLSLKRPDALPQLRS